MFAKFISARLALKSKLAAGIIALWILAAARTAIAAAPKSHAGSNSPEAEVQNPTQATQSYNNLPLSFEVNQGQADSGVKFLTRGKGYSLYLTGSAAILALAKDQPSLGQSAQRNCHPERSEGPASRPARPTRDADPCAAQPSSAQTAMVQTAMVQMQLANANPNARVEGDSQLPGIANYFLGNDPSHWRSNIPTYAKVRYSNVYDGIDLVFYGNGSDNRHQLEYDFVVAPNADPGRIRLRFAGPSHLALTPAGDLTVSAGSGGTATIGFRRPVVYQQSGARRIAVRGAFQLASSDTAVFRLGRYDRSRPLVIDPTLDYATDLGGASGAAAHAVALDAQGNVYVAGSAGPGLATLAPLQPAANSSSTGFISEINAAGTAVVYSTYLGGSGGDQINGIAIDNAGNIYVAGTTGSQDFPTLNPLQAAPKSGATGFVAEIKAGGASLVYSTYLGGSGGDGIAGIALDGSGDAYVAGDTTSSDFPLKNPIQSTNNVNGLDYQNPTGFVSEIAAGGASLVYSTYLGGSGSCDGNVLATCYGDQILAIAADQAGNAYVAGETGSYDFPIANALQSENINTTEIYSDFPYTGPNMGYLTTTGFVSKIQPGGGAFVYSTYLGGSGQCYDQPNTLGYDELIACSGDSAAAIAADAKGNAYVAGTAASPNFPLAHPLFGGSGVVSTGFVSVLNPKGSAFLYSTFLGGTGYCAYPQYYYQGTTEECFGDGLSAIATDASGNVYVAGNASSYNVPLKYPLQPSNTVIGGGTTPYIAALKSGGQSLLYSTYFGGSGNCNNSGYCVGDQATALAADSAGDVSVAGVVNSKNFPFAYPIPSATVGSVFLAKITPAPGPTLRPIFNPAPGTYNTIKQITIVSVIPEDIYYTTDGSTPTAQSANYRWPIVVTGNETIKAIGIAPGYLPSAVVTAQYVVNAQAAAPVFTPAAGTYAQGQTVAITDSTPNSVLYYTTDGTTPSAGSNHYSQPVSLKASETLKAIAYAPATNTPSPVSSAAYVVHLSLAEPVISLASGTYSTIQTVTVTNNAPGAILHYTLSGTPPTASSPIYSGPIYVAMSETLQVVAVDPNYPPSPIASATYTINLSLDEPVLSLAAGTYTGAQTVTVTDGTSVAQLFYTVNGTTPTANSPKYTGPITVGKSETLKVIALATGYPPSAVATAAYTIQ